MMRGLLSVLLVTQVVAQQTTEDDILNLNFGDACPKGTFSYSEDGTHQEFDECMQCIEGEHASEEASLFCNLCLPGSYTPEMGYWECVDCAAGYINSEEGSMECYPCGLGQFSAASGGDNCDNCAEGTFQDEEGSADCKTCSAGLWQDQSGSTSCNACPAGQSSPEKSISAGACIDCSAGTFAPAAGSESCEVCPIGTFQDLKGATSCKDCPSNTDTFGATECVVVITCQPGEVEKDGLCVACEAGTYEEKGACELCPAGSFSANEGSTTCDLCGMGQFSEEGASVCNSCEKGQYQDKKGSGYCEDCAAGSYSDKTGSTSCDMCEVGFYNPLSAQTACLECPAGAITDTEGQITCLECEAGSFSSSTSTCAICPAGSFSDDGAAACMKCIPGTFSAFEGSISCLPAPAGHFVVYSGATEAADCPAGSYCPEGAIKPTPCPSGSYSENSTLASVEECAMCPGGMYCSGEGLTAPSGACGAGYFCTGGSSVADQNECPAGSFCAAGSAAPTPCPASSYNPDPRATAMSECQVCPAGQFCGNTGLAQPSGACDAGYYCPAGSSSPQEEISPAGHYSGAGAAAPTPCPRNTYSADIGAVARAACHACPQGTATKTEGSTSEEDCRDINCAPGWYKDRNEGCLICPAGTFSNIVNAVACRKCPKDTYNSQEGSEHCMKCPDSAYTWASGTGDYEGCVGPVIELCTEENMEGECHKYYDDNLNITQHIESFKVIRGEFELYTATNLGGNFLVIDDSAGKVNVADYDIFNTEYDIRSFAAVLNDVFCYLEKGADFRGSIRDVSKSGKACLDWKDSPMSEKAKHNKLCQNPQGAQAKPFCYVSAEETEECAVPECVWDMECYSGIGNLYRGSKSSTIKGKSCQNWNKNWPHHSKYKYPAFEWAGIQAGDFRACRNPDNEGAPWCYTSKLFPIWDYCAVPRCDRDNFPFYKF